MFCKNTMASMLNLTHKDEEEIEAMKSTKIEYSKIMSKIMAESRKKAKQEFCYHCHKKVNSFCNSHSIPAFCLRNISENGEVYYSNTLVEIPLMDYDKGVNEAGTFKLICRECDSAIFSDYENIDKYGTVPTPKMIAQIAMKNHLRNISKRMLEIALYDHLKTKYEMPSGMHENKQAVNLLDLKEYEDGYCRAKKADEKNWSDEYYVFYYEKINHVVPIAFQGSVVLVVDLDGNLVNDIYSRDPSYILQELHICIFPLQDSTVVIMFINKNHKRYQSFYKQFRKLDQNDKLATINYIVFLYSEDVYFSKKIDSEVIKHPGLKEISGKTSIAQSITPFFDAIETAKEEFGLSGRHEIPNLLDENHAIK